MMDRKCYVCKTTIGIECHHVFYGTSNRKHSEKHGMKVDLCHYHHRGNGGVHFNRKLDIHLKKLFQQQFEEHHSHSEFMEVFGRNYL